jgi:hypothetical protein
MPKRISGCAKHILLLKEAIKNPLCRSIHYIDFLKLGLKYIVRLIFLDFSGLLILFWILFYFPFCFRILTY